ncbi:MAG: plasmid stabilization system [bacterium]|jgi:mRNA interferase RelE/StbE|nr:MAG: plasmid stabilization system [bacterium]
MHKIVLHKNAVKFYKNADAMLKERISSALNAISKDPRYNVHIKKLKGELKNMYRFRLGDIRILYEIEEDIQTVRVKLIDTRGSVYKHISE